tara:strand:- start:187 stop:681 length:495 start_codon:yes stop_codon:yes gene_type:complete
MEWMRWFSLPLRAPLLIVLFGVSAVMGHQWTLLSPRFSASSGLPLPLLFGLEVLQLLLVLILCTMPDLLMRRVSLLMASSRSMTLLVTLLVVIGAGIYLLRLNVLTDVLIIASALLLARLDLVRIGLDATPVTSILLLGTLLFGGVVLGHSLPHPSFVVVTPPG